jgi:hypothetical protein
MLKETKNQKRETKKLKRLPVKSQENNLGKSRL